MKSCVRKARVSFVPLWILALMILSGCNQNEESLLKKYTPPEDETIATNYIALLRHGRFESIEKDLDPRIKNDLARDTLVRMAQAIPSPDPISVKVIGAHQFRTSDLYKINLSFEYQFPSQWMLINVATQRKGGITTIVGFNVYPLSDSLENLNKFALFGKAFLQYATLAFAILIPIFTLYALVLCFRTKIVKRKWLWLIFVLMGIGKITVNWTTNQWNFATLTFQILGSSAFAPPYGAWLISVSLPLGAIVFLFRRKTLSTPAAQVTSMS
jgi:hypothetical protein